MQLFKISEKTSGIILILFFFIIGVLLYLRDVCSLTINKYIFLLVALLAFSLVNRRDSFAFMSFLIPLYSGLPGNYISLAFLVVMWLHKKSTTVTVSVFLPLLFIIALELVNQALWGITFESLIWVTNIILLVAVILSNEINTRPQKAIIAFTIGLILANTIILLQTNNMGVLEKVMVGRYRLGELSDFAGNSFNNQIHINADSNYIGFYSITAIVALYMSYMNSKKHRVILLALMIICCGFGILTLSRTFIISFIIFVLYILFSRSNSVSKLTKKFVVIFLLVVILYFLYCTLLSIPVHSLMMRLTSHDVLSGGGRLSLLQKYIIRWLQSPVYILFGTGMLTIRDAIGLTQNLHCVPAEFLVGSGVLGTMAGLFLIRGCVNKKKALIGVKKINIRVKLFFILQVLYLSTLPAMENPIQLFPITICAFASCIYTKKEDVYEKIDEQKGNSGCLAQSNAGN